jgi:hypothetical protein
VNLLLAQRQIALAGIALLAGIVALALSSTGGRPSGPDLPEAIPAPGGGWFSALATSHGPTFARSHLDETCGHEVGPSSLGVAHPWLPCDSKVYIQYGDREALTQVLVRKTAGPNFELAPALARKLGLTETQRIKWRYAR